MSVSRPNKEDLENQSAYDLPDYNSQLDPLLSHNAASSSVQNNDSDALIANTGLIRVDIVTYKKISGAVGYGARLEIGSVLINYSSSLPRFLDTL